MKVFISWSGKYSKECAEILRDWIKCALQASEPWISSKDIDKGSLWFNEISDQLKDTKVGIVCLTKDNKEKPWILFESGALAKGLSSNRVCTLLINLKPSDLDGPLSQFNHTVPEKDSMKALLITINKELGERRLEEKTIDQIFDIYWPSFQMKFNEIIKADPEEGENASIRSGDDMLEEILNTTRAMDRRIQRLEINTAKDPIRPDRISRSGAENLIRELINSGLTPVEVMEKMQGMAPQSFIMKMAVHLWEEKTNLANEPGDNA